MRRVLTTTNESHPDVPGDVTGEGSIFGPVLWQIYVDGTPFLGIPAGGDAHDEAHAQATKILATGRYEYVDVRLRPDRRTEGDRRGEQPSRRPVPDLLSAPRARFDNGRRGYRDRRRGSKVGR